MISNTFLLNRIHYWNWPKRFHGYFPFLQVHFPYLSSAYHIIRCNKILSLPVCIFISLIPQCTGRISHNAPFCNRNVHACAHFCYKMVHCGIWEWGIFGLTQSIIFAGNEGSFITKTIFCNDSHYKDDMVVNPSYLYNWNDPSGPLILLTCFNLYPAWIRN